MNPEQLQNTWDRTSSSFSEFDYNRDNRVPRKRKTALEQLADRYRRFAIVSTVMVICGPCMFYNVPLTHMVKPWFLAFVSVYFFVAAMMDFGLCSIIRKIDVYAMPMSEIIRRALKCRRYHHYCMIVLIPCAAFIMVELVRASGGDTFLITGMFAGALVGLIIGLVAYFRFMSDYKVLTSDE